MVEKKELLAFNRGIVVNRITETARELGIPAATVFTPDDKESLHAKSADEACEIKNYSDIPGAIEITRRIGAKFIHPGYGFGSEDPEFARICREAGIVFIGPCEMAMRQAGNKETAKEIARSLGIPVIESFSGSGQDIRSWAIDLGLSDKEDSVPIMLKAARAGGGNGNRLVSKLSYLGSVLDKLEQNFPSNGKEPNLFAERFIPAQHIEVQLLGDEHGGLVHLGTRNCSIQLRRQKVVEEAPAPFLSETQEKRLYNYALKLGEHIGYTNAGTVEFLVDQKGNIFFLEFNTRLQVEHRVTELITGRDLVGHQIEIAEGGYVPSQKDIKFAGSAIEARINAQRFHEGTLLPADGTVERVIFPKGKNIIVDHNLYNGYKINLNYDPTQAIVAVWGADRGAAIAALQKALKGVSIEGVSTNIDFVLSVLSSKEFARREHTTTFFEEMLEEMGMKGRKEKEKNRELARSGEIYNHSPNPWKVAGLMKQMRPNNGWTR